MCRWEQEITYGGRRDCLLYDWLPDEKKKKHAHWLILPNTFISWLRDTAFLFEMFGILIYIYATCIICCNMQVLECHFGKKKKHLAGK